MAAPMESDTTTAIPKIDWLYPELLSKEGLIEILSQRFVKLPDDLEATTKDSLLELYYRYIIPRPQRQYRLNRRGREMTRKQVIRAKKRKATERDTSEPASKKAAENSSRLLTSFGDISLGSRLKPPPSCINFEKKVIRLGTTKSSGSSVSNSAGKDHGDSSSSSSSGSTVIKLNRTSSQGGVKSPNSSETICMTKSKTVKLINSHLGASGDGVGGKEVRKKGTEVKPRESKQCGEEKMDTDGNPSPPKKTAKIKRISWP